ncbi:MAG: two-component regulator propeller domain-containing protein [Flavobacteriales bacterium]
MHTPTRRFLLLLLLFIVAFQGQAQRYFFENVAVRDGLPASKVYALLQDSTGLLWVGTEAGLASYDGNRVRAYGTNDHLAPNGARSLFLDKNLRLWVGHLGGGISLKEGNRFRTLHIGKAPPTRDITGIAQDGKGDIWIATFGEGAYRISEVGKDGPVEAEIYDEGRGLSTRVTGITTLNDGRLLFLEANGDMKIWDVEKQAFQAFKPKGLPMLLAVTTVFQDSRDGLWIGTQSSGAVHLDSRTGEVETYDIATALPSNFVMCFSEDEQGRIWVGSWDNGLARIEKNGIRRFNTGNGTHSQRMRCMARDREGNMLVGTHDAGLEVYKGDRFKSFTEEDHLVDKQVWAITETRDGNLWFGTNGGITILVPGINGAGTVRHLTMQGGQLTSNHVRALVEDQRGHVWIGTEDGGLFDFDPNTFRPNNSLEVAGSIAENKVTALAVGEKGELWIGTINGLVHSVDGLIPTVMHVADGLTGEHVTALYRDSRGVLWVGSSSGGVSRIEGGKAAPLNLGFTYSPTCFTQDAKGRVWVGTEGRGILVLDNGKQVAKYTTDEGLISNSIRALVTDKVGHVWIGTNRGLNEWQPEKDHFIRYSSRSGFTGIETKPNSAILLKNGDLWFGTANGAICIGALPDQNKVVPPTVAIRGLKINLEDRNPGKSIELDHTESNMRIEYGSVSLSDPEAVRYQYYLDGLDKTWQPLTEETDVHYPSLPAGNYEFKVKAVGRSGLFSPQPAEMHFTILPPWYRSWWFYTAVAIALIAGTISYVKVRERQLKMRNQVLEHRVEERTAEVRAKGEEIAGQKVRIEELLLNILPKTVSDELRDTGKATARRFNDVTVMFTDMKGFTTMAEKMTPEQLVAELDECFVRFDHITSRYGIEKIKTIGDSYMSACGLPVPVEHHALRAVMAAIDVREEMVRWHAEREGSKKAAWVLRIGLHSGPVVAGVVGKRKFAYDIWGDTVNTASRMESSGEPGEVNVSGTTYELVKDHFVCEHRGQVEAKNKGKIDMYFVRRLKPEYSGDKTGFVANARFMEVMGLAVEMEHLA